MVVTSPPQEAMTNPRVPLQWKNGSATFMLSLAGMMVANLAPLIMTVLNDSGFSIVDAGNILTVALLASAIVGLATARIASGNKRRLLATVGLLIAVIGFGISAFLPNQAIVVASFIAGGAGIGAAISGSGAAIAAIRNPNRVSATAGLVNRLLIMIVLAIIPLFGLSQVSVYGALALFSFISLLLVAWLPNAPEYAEPVAVMSSPSVVAPRRITVAGIVLLILFPIWAASEDAIWTLTSVVGDNVGLESTSLGLALSAAAGGGAIAMVVVIIFGQRIGRAVPLTLALLLGGVMKIWIGHTAEPTMLVALIIAVNTLYGFVFVLILATSAGLDARGRWSAPLFGAGLVGSSFAPLIGAWLIELFGIPTFGTIMGVVSFVVLIPIFWIARTSTAAEQSLTSQQNSEIA